MRSEKVDHKVESAIIRNGATTQDEADLAEQGKTQQLSRNFGLWSMVGFTATMMCTWEAILFACFTALLNGGGPTLFYGLLFAWAGNLVTAASLAEMASMAPTSGGQYHAVALLAPPGSRRFLSWFTGWIATIGWNANTAAGVFFGATITQGLLVLNYPSYVPERWQGTLLMYACLLVVVIVNTLGARLLPKIEYLVLALHTAGFLIILVILAVLAPKSSASFVFSDFDASEAGWNSNGLAWFIGLISVNLPFVGYDGPWHLSEEVKNASVNVPKAMFMTIILNGLLGFGITVAFLFGIGDLSQAITPPTGYAFIGTFYQATNSIVGSSIMTAIPTALVICASFGFLASASRQTWAFARDRGLPFSDFLAHVNQRNALPLRSIFFCTIFTAIICLINIGSTVAFNAIVSITIAGLFTSYLIPICLMIRKRLTGEDAQLRFGPWRMGKFTGLAVNILSAIYLVISVVFSFFPPGLPVTLQTMNWSCVVWGGIVLLGLVWYAALGRRRYNGPIMEIPQLARPELRPMEGSE
ncbi:hypothetical protein MBLNU459_g2662t1 [Dothideomycetes sp. NU459]